MPDTEIISTLRLALSSRIGPERFGLWFGATTRMTLDETSLRVEAADRFSSNWIRNHFRGDLESILLELGGQGQIPRVSGVTFRVDSSLKQTTVRQSGDQENSEAVSTQLRLQLGSESAPRENPTVCDEGCGPRSSSDTNTDTSVGFGGVHQKGSTDRGAKRKFSKLSDFVVSSSSRLAYTSCEIVIEQPGSVTPLLIHGPHGVGKTHLLESIWSELRRSRRLRRVVYLSAEQFTGYFLQALHGTGLPNFRRKYRDVELLIVDDVQFFAGKRATLIELLHTIDAVLREGRQLVFAADRPPSELEELGPDIVGRLAGGLVCGIDPPCAVARHEIAARWARICQVSVPDPVLDYVAHHLPGDARQLRGAINRLKAASQAHRVPVSESLAAESLADLIRSTRHVCRINDVERAVCDLFGLEPKILQSSRREKRVAQPRMLAMWLARKYTRSALSEIGNYFGGRSHSTVISAQKKVQGWIAQGESVQLADQTWRMQEALAKIETRLRIG